MSLESFQLNDRNALASADGLSVTAIWNRWVIPGARAGETVDPGLQGARVTGIRPAAAMLNGQVQRSKNLRQSLRQKKGPAIV